MLDESRKISELVIGAYNVEELFAQRKLKQLIIDQPCLGLKSELEVSEAIIFCVKSKEIGAACLISLYCSYFENVTRHFFNEWGLHDSHCAFLASKYYYNLGEEEEGLKFLKSSKELGNVHAEKDYLTKMNKYGIFQKVQFYFKQIYMYVRHPFSPNSRNMI